jgi:hypothetical protein
MVRPRSIDAYSVIVTEALAGPSAISGSDTGLATSDALCAIASAIRCSGENPTRHPVHMVKLTMER